PARTASRELASRRHHPVEAPAVGDPLELVLASVLEVETAARHKILHGLRDPDLRRACGGRDPCADRDAQPGDVVAVDLDLARVDAGPDLDAELARPPSSLEGARDRARRPVERHE